MNHDNVPLTSSSETERLADLGCRAIFDKSLSELRAVAESFGVSRSSRSSSRRWPSSGA